MVLFWTLGEEKTDILLMSLPNHSAAHYFLFICSGGLSAEQNDGAADWC